MDINEIKALLSLLDDPDQDVQTQIRDKIIQEGRSLVPFLDEYLENEELDKDVHSRVNDICRDIQISGLQNEMDEWFEEGAQDLVKGAMIVCRYEYPDLDEEEIRGFLSRMRQDVWLELNDSLTAFERVKVLNIVFFEEYGFTGNKDDYHLAENSFINKVIENKQGNPLLLSILYMSIAQQLDIPIRGVNLPNHFLVAYMDDLGLIDALSPGADGVLFYINPFSRGAILNKEEINTFLTHLDLRPEPRFFKPCSNADMIRRMVNNLIHSYQKNGEEVKANELTRFVQSVPTEN